VVLDVDVVVDAIFEAGLPLTIITIIIGVLLL